jgi:mannosyltransferase OCH1-like enzyme
MIAPVIPRTIHYCWFGGRPPGSLMRRCMQSWHARMPDYEVKRWDETNSPLDGQYAREACARRLWSPLSNYIRLYALYTEGGIYLDTDVETLKSFTPLLDDHCFLGFQQETEGHDWVNTAVLAAEKGHPFLKTCMDQLTDAFERQGRFHRSPTLTTAVLCDWGLKQYGFQRIRDVTIYPVQYFYPFSWLEKQSARRYGEETYCVHHWAASWKSRVSLEWPSAIRRLKRAAVAWLRRKA